MKSGVLVSKLYHGSIYNFRSIDTNLGSGYKDFGKGFYTTASKEHARNIAYRNAVLHNDNAKEQLKINRNTIIKPINCYYIYNFIFEPNFNGLNVKIFEKADLEWVKFLLINRDSAVTKHKFDIVIGPTADARTMSIINRNLRYRGRVSDMEIYTRLLRELEPENLPNQYFFATNRAVEQTLRFAKVPRDIMYLKR